MGWGWGRGGGAHGMCILCLHARTGCMWLPYSVYHMHTTHLVYICALVSLNTCWFSPSICLGRCSNSSRHPHFWTCRLVAMFPWGCNCDKKSCHCFVMFNGWSQRIFKNAWNPNSTASILFFSCGKEQYWLLTETKNTNACIHFEASTQALTNCLWAYKKRVTMCKRM